MNILNNDTNMQGYSIKVNVVDGDGTLIFNQQVSKPEELVKVAEIIPEAIKSFEAGKDMIKKAIFDATGVPF